MNENHKKVYKSLPKSKIKALFDTLAAHIDPKPELKFNSALDLLVAVVLSAQCTDKAVNKATAELWKTVRTPQDYINLGQEKLENAIHSLGFHKVKAEHIIALCKILLEKYNGNVPQSREELTTLPGVGRKTASVVLNVWFKQPTIAVDTHIFRVSHRVGLSNALTPDETSVELENITPKEHLLNAHHYLLLHGRYTCQARSPKCEQCSIEKLCRKNHLH